MGDYDYPALDPMEMLALSGGLREPEEKAPPYEPPSRSKGYYRVKLFGQAGGLLYEAIVQPYTSFQYVSSYGGLKVSGFEMIWEPTE